MPFFKYFLVIIRTPEDNIILFSKGAESVIFQKVILKNSLNNSGFKKLW